MSKRKVATARAQVPKATKPAATIPDADYRVTWKTGYASTVPGLTLRRNWEHYARHALRIVRIEPDPERRAKHGQEVIFEAYEVVK